MFVRNSEMQSTPCEKGVSRKILGRGGKVMMTEVTFQKGAVGNRHSHPHEQVSYIHQGSFNFHLDGREQVLNTGDSVYVGPDLKHGVTALEQPSIIVDIFCPQRQDFLK
jgi:quercetin dioxygenase-like cupin family protein